jgi:hypothetical protein
MRLKKPRIPRRHLRRALTLWGVQVLAMCVFSSSQCMRMSCSDLAEV